MRLLAVLLLVSLGLVSSKSLQSRDLPQTAESLKENLHELLGKAQVQLDKVKEGVKKGLNVDIDTLNQAHDFAAAVVKQGKEKVGEGYEKAVEIKDKLAEKLKALNDLVKLGVSKTNDRISAGLDDELWMINDAADAVKDAYKSVKGWLSELGKRSIRDDVIIEKLPFKRGLGHGDVIIEKLPFKRGLGHGDVIIAKLPFKRGLIQPDVVIENIQQQRFFGIEYSVLVLKDVIKKIRDDLSVAIDTVKVNLEKFKQDHGGDIQKAKSKINAIKEKIEPAFNEAYENLEEAVSIGGGRVNDAVSGIKSWMWDVIDTYLEPYTDKKKREIQGYGDMSDNERNQWSGIIHELKSVLKNKYGIQDPDEAFRLDPATRELYKQVQKELMEKLEEKNGHVNGYEDLTDDEWKQKWGKVVGELKDKFVTRQIDIDLSFRKFLKDEYEKISSFFKKIFGRASVDLKSANKYISTKFQEVLTAAKDAKENFNVEDFKDDVRSRMNEAIEKAKSLGGKVSVQTVKDAIRHSVDSAVLAARKLKSDVEALNLKEKIQSGVDDVTHRLNTFVSKYVTLQQLEDELATLKETINSKVKVALNSINAHSSNLAQIRRDVLEKVNVALNSVKDRVHAIDLDKVKTAIIRKVNKAIEQAKVLGEKAGEELEKAKVKANEMKEDISTKLKEAAEKFGKRALKSYEEMTAEEREQQNALLTELRQKLGQKFGQVDPDAEYRLSPETRHNLKQMIKQMGKHQTYDDRTDEDWKQKWEKVVKELKTKFQ